ncbi:MAG TPA: AmmeMemoRadiSam system protein A [Phycisphaerae bacterium]|nr:AmmeMemoRadiSam system protein A [Phycisphaerae bacterium]
MLTDADRRALLKSARQTLGALLSGKPVPRLSGPSPTLAAPGGAFVTLKNQGRLRGCIGTFQSAKPLWETVQQMTAAATRDPRFLSNPISAGELDKIDVEISVLSPLEKVSDPMKEIQLGRHGISIEGPHGSGCFLPQVAEETGWSKEEFLSMCCSHKAGLAPDAWKQPNVAVYRFEADVFGEKDNI